MAQVRRAQAFGSEGTERKLDVVTTYLREYCTVMKDQGFSIAYLDALAGSGWRNLLQIVDGQSPLDLPAEAPGAALRALRVPGRRFDRYAFNDGDPSNVESLRAAVRQELERDAAASPPRPLPRVDFSTDDANAFVERECALLGPGWRAVLFLDPFGLQVEWRTISRVAETRSVDLWYLVPTGMALNRLMQRDGGIPPGWTKALDQSLGGNGWRERFYGTARQETGRPQGDLFQAAPTSGGPTLEGIGVYVRELLQDVVGGHRVPEGLPLRWRGVEQYRLFFACTNPKPQAHVLANKLAEHIMEIARRGGQFRHRVD